MAGMPNARLAALSLLIFSGAASLRADVFNMPAGQTSLQTVAIGNPGNVSDPTAGSFYGSVAYNYSIGKYDVTISQYTAFLNAVAATDTYGLYNSNMATIANIAGISRSGSSGSYSYNVIGSANKPITYVSWGSAARFTNWLANGQPIGAEGNGTTETGSYTLNGATTDSALLAVGRNSHATWAIPSEDEWYKAAYYNLATSTYYQYPYSSNTVPTSAMPGSTPNTGNFYDSTTGYAVTGSTTSSNNQNYLTDVGAYTASGSPSGAFDMGGDVAQWNEAVLSGAFRGEPRWGVGLLSVRSRFFDPGHRRSCARGPVYRISSSKHTTAWRFQSRWPRRCCRRCGHGAGTGQFACL